MAVYKTRAPSYLLLLLLVAFALVGFVGYQKMRDSRLANNLIRMKEAEIENLQEDLQKEREAADQLRDKLEELRKRTDILRSEKVTLTRQLYDMENVKNTIEEDQKRLQSSLQNKGEEIVQLKEREKKAIEEKGDVQAITVLLDKKENELKEMKARLAEFEEEAGKARNNGEKIETHPSDDVGKSSTGNMSSEENHTIEDTKDKSDRLKEETMDKGSFQGTVMENVEKDALKAKVGTTIHDGELHDRQLEESNKLQESRTRDEEEETEGGNDNPDDIKELEDLEVNDDDKDPEDEQGQETEKDNDDEETDI